MNERVTVARVVAFNLDDAEGKWVLGALRTEADGHQTLAASRLTMDGMKAVGEDGVNAIVAMHRERLED